MTMGYPYPQRLALVTVILLGNLIVTPSAFSQSQVRSPRAVSLDYMTSVATNVKSPDGSCGITVTGKEEPFKAWVTVDCISQGWPIQVWPIERSVKVLWNPDSRTFALTDNRYANESYVLVVGTNFHRSGPQLGISYTDITPLIRKSFVTLARYYYVHKYGTPSYDNSYNFYAGALRWVTDTRLLVGVSTITTLPLSINTPESKRGFQGWIFAYLIDVPTHRIIRKLTKSDVLNRYGIDLSKWAMHE